LVYRASHEIGGENYFAAVMAFASRHRTCEWREKLAAAAQPESSPETYLYDRALRGKGNYENQSEKQVGKYLRNHRHFGLHF
jgi:phosphatidate phosphatase PAH1